MMVNSHFPKYFPVSEAYEHGAVNYGRSIIANEQVLNVEPYSYFSEVGADGGGSFLTIIKHR